MKRLILWLTLLTLCAVLTAAPALAYWDYQMRLALMDDELPMIYGTLNQRMATRTGPSTEYPEPGTFLSKGEEVRIISISFDVNSVPWVQVDLPYGGQYIRAYTGLKRFDGVDSDDIPREFYYNIEAKLNQDYKPLYGPGLMYASYDYTLKAGSSVVIVDFENGYTMCEFLSGDDQRNRVWIADDALDTVG